MAMPTQGGRRSSAPDAAPQNAMRGSMTSRGWFRVALGCVAAALALIAAAGEGAMAGDQVPAGPASGLPVPRFVSLKSDRVNVRAGPTRDHDVAWIYTRAALPVEVTAEFENWRRIRDWEGAE